ncbi:hypothetical protein CPC16_004857 [Podila verticillata]|nr:hypothetical protein BGZ59_000421 [Podila verticillata]KAF9390733.1 hypothetical protein CPC16_004857 [Podila verticillata]
MTALSSKNPHSELPNTDLDTWRDTKAAIVDMFGVGESQHPFDSSPGRPHIRLVIERAQKRYESVLARRKQPSLRTAAFECPHDIERVGSLADGKWTCGFSLYETQPWNRCVVYVFGVGLSSSFENKLLKRTDCEIYACDHKALPMDEGSARFHKRVHFKRYAFGREDTTDSQGVQWRILQSLMKENGHIWIDILHIDIEGGEFQAFDTILKDFDTLPFSQLLIQLHGGIGVVTWDKFQQWWDAIEARGVFSWWSEPIVKARVQGGELPSSSSEYSFLNTRGDAKDVLIQDN